MDKAGKMTNLTRMQQRIDTAESWTKDNPILMEGEIGYEAQSENSGKVMPPKEKVGDGKTVWNDLPYLDAEGGAFKTYITPTVTIVAGAEHAFTYPSSDKILTQVYEVSDGDAHDNKNIAFDSADKYDIQNKSNLSVGGGKAQLEGGADTYTKLLLHMNGTNGNTSFIDSSPNPKAVTSNNVSISTSFSKFGEASGYFNGDNSYLSIPNTSDFNFGSNDFTIDMWIYPIQNAQDGMLFCKRPSTFICSGFYAFIRDGVILINATSNNSSWDVFNNATIITGITYNSWNHIAIVKNDSLWSGFLNGSLSKTLTTSATIADRSYPAIIGGDTNLNFYKGYIDEYRISSIARWTSDFTSPDSEYQNTKVNMPCNFSTTDLSNYSFSKINQINSITIPVTTPANTSVKILTSFDGRKTWLYHDNTGWHSFEAVGSEWTVGNSSTELQNYFTNLSMTQLISDLGYTPSTIDFMFQLDTTDASATPVVSALTMNYTAEGGLECADVGSYDDTSSRYGLKITSPTQLSVKNKDTASHTISIDIVPITNITYLN